MSRSWATTASTGGGGSGNVTGPGSSTDNAIVRWDGASGTVIQNSNVIVADSGTISLLQTTTLATILGDVTGNARGDGALDIQSSHVVGANYVASGLHSVAVGYSNLASGLESTAIGHFSVADGDISVALGTTSASGYQSVSVGSGNQASAASTSAFGVGNIIVGKNSTASGYVNTASGYYSIASGWKNSAGADKSTASGYSNIITGTGGATAVGRSNTASGYKATAVGAQNTSSADYATAVGSQNTAQTVNSSTFGRSNFTSTGGLASVVMGVMNNQTGGTLDLVTGVITGTPSTISDVGPFTTTVGVSNTASAKYGTAVGYGNTTDVGGWGHVSVGHKNSASGYYGSSAIGVRNTANSESSAIGFGNTANGGAQIGVVAMGYLNTASGYYGGAAVGWTNIASGNQATAFGMNNQALPASTGATAFGYANVVSSSYSSGFGVRNTASGYYSSALGYNNIASQSRTTASGYSNTASGYHASAFGYGNIVAGDYATGIGYRNTASASYSSVFGSNINNSTANTFQFGPGDDSKAIINSTGNLAIRAGASAGTIAKVGGAIFDHYSDVGNTTTSETDLYNDVIPASVLNTVGDKLCAEYGGVFVSSGTATREIRGYFAGTKIFDTGALTLSLSSAWTMYVSIIMDSSTSVRYMISFTTEGAALAAYTAVGKLTGLTLTGTNILKITGQAAGIGAATNDIVAELGTVSWQSAA